MIFKHFWATTLALLALAAVAVGVPSPASADVTISFDDASSQSGTGFGNVGNILALQQPNGQTTIEYGSVSWDGTNLTDVTTGDTKNPTQTRTSGELATAMGITIGSQLGGATFRIVFNISDPGSSASVLLQEFNVTFQGNDGATLFGPGTFTPSSTDPYYEQGPPSGLRLTPVKGNGTGTADWIFVVTLGATEATSLFASDNNRIGMFVTMQRPISDVADGIDNFFLGTGQVIAPVPEPATILSASLALVVGGLYSLRRRCQRPVTD